MPPDGHTCPRCGYYDTSSSDNSITAYGTFGSTGNVFPSTSNYAFVDSTMFYPKDAPTAGKLRARFWLALDAEFAIPREMLLRSLRSLQISARAVNAFLLRFRPGRQEPRWRSGRWKAKT